MLGGIETQKPLALAMDHRIGHYHLGIEQRAARELAVQEPAMPIRPVHHRRDGDNRSLEVSRFLFVFRAFHLDTLLNSPARIRPFCPKSADFGDMPVVYPVSDAASYTTGTTLPIDDGLTSGFFTGRNDGDYSSKRPFEAGTYTE